jgi:hypothetical protein
LGAFKELKLFESESYLNLEAFFGLQSLGRVGVVRVRVVIEHRLVVLHDRFALAAVGFLALIAAWHGDEVDERMGMLKKAKTISIKIEKKKIVKKIKLSRSLL